MNYKLIMLDNPILVSDEDVNPHNEVWDFENNQITVLRQSYGLTNYMKIIAGLPDLPKVDLSLIAEEIGWVDVEKLAKDYSGMRSAQSSSVDTSLHNARVAAFREGFKTANSLNEKKYSEEDVRQIIRQAIWYTARFGEDSLNREKDILHSLKPKEYLVEVEMEEGEVWNGLDTQKYRRIKITNDTIKVVKIL